LSFGAEIGADREQLPRLPIDALQSISGLRRQTMRDGEQILIRRRERERGRRQRRDQQECEKGSQTEA
jgi:hypothetical protein